MPAWCATSRRANGLKTYVLKTAETRKAAPRDGLFRISPEGEDGAGDEIRTHDPNLGKVMLYP